VTYTSLNNILILAWHVLESNSGQQCSPYAVNSSLPMMQNAVNISIPWCAKWCHCALYWFRTSCPFANHLPCNGCFGLGM